MKQLTHLEIGALPVKDRQYDVHVGGKHGGLVVRVHRSGTKTFRLRYQLKGKRRWYVIGEFPLIDLRVARSEAKRLLGLVERGRDPAFERREERRVQRTVGSVADLAQRYLVEYARPRKRSAAEDERVLRKELLPRFGDLPARELTKGHILEILDDARKRGVEGGLNNIHAILRKLCRWGAAQDILESNPAATIERPAPVRARDRILTREELGRYWNTLATASIDFRTKLALQIQALTALRIGEVVGARRIEVQLSERKFVIPAERMKAKQAHAVPLTDAVAMLFEQALHSTDPKSPFVFPSNSATEPIRARSVVRALSRLQPAFGFDAPFTSHDLRRTAATTLIEAGFQPAVVDRVLAHVPTGVLDRHYNLHAYRDEKREALDHWSRVVLDASTLKWAMR